LKYFNKLNDASELSIKVEKFEKDAHDAGLSSFEEFYASRIFQSRYRLQDNKIYYAFA